MSRKTLHRGIITAILGIIGVIVSAELIVLSAVNVISFLNVSQTFVGATVIAVGTSLPELALSLRAMHERRFGLAFGNAVGSNFANITLVLGLVISAAPLQLEVNLFLDMIIFSLFANIVLWYFLSINWIEWRTGLILFLIYILFISSMIQTVFI